MPQFKHGDRVKCTINGCYIEDAKISIDPDGTPFIPKTLDYLNKVKEFAKQF